MRPGSGPPESGFVSVGIPADTAELQDLAAGLDRRLEADDVALLVFFQHGGERDSCFCRRSTKVFALKPPTIPIPQASASATLSKVLVCAGRSVRRARA